MSIGCFVDKSRASSPEEMQSALGPAFPHWERLMQFIAATYAIPPALNFGGKNYGWNLWYRNGGKSLVSLYPQAEWLHRASCARQIAG